MDFSCQKSAPQGSPGGGALWQWSPHLFNQSAARGRKFLSGNLDETAVPAVAIGKLSGMVLPGLVRQSGKSSIQKIRPRPGSGSENWAPSANSSSPFVAHVFGFKTGARNEHLIVTIFVPGVASVLLFALLHERPPRISPGSRTITPPWQIARARAEQEAKNAC